MKLPKSFPVSSATFSDDPGQVYRYTLRRGWNCGKGTLCVILLNPSTADATKLDPTLRRCVAFAIAWGYSDLVVLNLFALRSTDPGKLKQVADPEGPMNDHAILSEARQADCVVCGWGFHGQLRGRAVRVVEMLRAAEITLWKIGPEVTANGQPRHPLYLSSALRPVLMQP